MSNQAATSAEPLNQQKVEAGEADVIEDVGELLDATVAFLRRFVVMTPDQAAAMALWITHTHAFEASDYTLYPFITSAERASGKSRLKEVCELLVADPISTVNATPAAIFHRATRKPVPTFLIDELDEIFAPKSDRSELRGLLNGGFRRGEKVLRQDRDSHEDRDFDIYCPKLLAGKNSAHLGDTLASRCVPIELKKKLREETVERFRRKRLEQEEATKRLTCSLVRFGERHVDELRDAEPGNLPERLSDRGWDMWEPLFAIADLAGVKWSRRARSAAVTLADVEFEESIGVQLLADIRSVFGADDRLSTEDLINRLCADEEKPWASWHKGFRISPKGLARLLATFSIHSGSIRHAEGRTSKGFQRQWFEDAWARYLSPPCTASPGTPSHERDGVTANEPRAEETPAKRPIAEHPLFAVTNESF